MIGGLFSFTRRLCSLAVLVALISGCNGQSSTQPADSMTQDQFIDLAERELERLNISPAGRTPTVTRKADAVTVVFPPPRGARAGDFTIVLDPRSGAVLRTEIRR